MDFFLLLDNILCATSQSTYSELAKPALSILISKRSEQVNMQLPSSNLKDEDDDGDSGEEKWSNTWMHKETLMSHPGACSKRKLEDIVSIHGTDNTYFEEGSKTPHLLRGLPSFRQRIASSLLVSSQEDASAAPWSIKASTPSALHRGTSHPSYNTQHRMMDHLDWCSGQRANRPFLFNSQRSPRRQDPNNPILPPRLPISSHRSSYFQEQLYLGRPDRYRPLILYPVRPGTVKLCLIDTLNKILVLHATIIIMPMCFIFGILTTTCLTIKYLFVELNCGLIIIHGIVCDIWRLIHWEMISILFVAFHAATLLPGLESNGDGKAEWSPAEPVYMIRVQNGYSFGSGPVR